MNTQETQEQQSLFLCGKLFLRGRIRLLTGLRIGGSKEGFEIGGVDLVVIKTPQGVPYIPGSSLKGKLRSLLAWSHGSLDIKNDPPQVSLLFGDAKEGKDHDKGNPSRILVRDASLDTAHFAREFPEEQVTLETRFTEVKTENRIQRVAGKAEHPRQLERVPAGAEFSFEIVLSLFGASPGKTAEELIADPLNAGHLGSILKAMRLLEHDYLGGQGSRGYGKIAFHGLTQQVFTLQHYQGSQEQAPSTPFVLGTTA